MSKYIATDKKITSFIKQAQQENKDGVIFKNIREAGHEDTDEYVIFESNKVKSIDNKGNFSKTSNNIYE